MKTTTHDLTHPGRQLNIATPKLHVQAKANQNKPSGKHPVTHPTHAGKACPNCGMSPCNC